MKFGVVPPEVPVQRSLDLCAPKFAAAVRAALASIPDRGLGERVFETLRTEERQQFLYGFGRTYDDDRGIVTNANTALYSWHGFGLACDVVEKDGTPWDAPETFWQALGGAAEANGLVWGGRWAHRDRPHVQWARCPVSPTQADRELFESDGIQAVWEKYGADT